MAVAFETTRPPWIQRALGVVGMGFPVTSLLLASKLMGKKMWPQFRA